MSSKWSIFLNNEQYCPSMRVTGNRPCDLGMMCDKCHYDTALQKKFEEVKDSINEEDYCKCCGHKLTFEEKAISLVKDGYCDDCSELNEDIF